MPRRGNQLDAWQIRTLADLKKIGFEAVNTDLFPPLKEDNLACSCGVPLLTNGGGINLRLQSKEKKFMAQDNRSQNQPSHDASVKGGLHSHDEKSTSGQQQQQSGNQGQPGQQSGNQGQQGQHNAPSHDASEKGGQHSHSGEKR